MTYNETIQEIKNRLIQALQPSFLEVTDDSAAHRGHLPPQSEQGHFTIAISSAHFVTASLVECHKLVYQALGDLLPRKIHAVKIKIIK